ncbi:replication initiation protein [Pandoraea sp. PE-S2T-3]|uniref:replication initiation protein n=1 Tax=Pandoraea sp. PE-S2T-3 TaxID=1986993 RepID=UPI000B3FA8AE|nr:replication initiation protein [Pandoraea sp. PE-S2T-3]
MEAYTDQMHLFKSSLPYRPWATDDLASGIRILGREAAARRRYVQPNPPALRTWIVFDVDRAGAAHAWEDANVAPPSWIAVNPANAHAHLAYGLEVPVVTSDAGRLDPLRYAAAVEAGYRRALGADRSYAGLMCKNPLHPDWRVLWGREDRYDLPELAEWLPVLPKPEKRAEASGLGRNVSLFDALRRWAYRTRRSFPGTAEQWAVAVLDRSELLNADFATPLPFGEVKATAKSVAKWTWKHTTAEGFSQWQAGVRHRTGNTTHQLILTELGL